MLQWIIQNIGTVPLLYTLARSWNVEVDSHVVVNRVVHHLRNLGIEFRVHERGQIAVTVTAAIARELQELRERITQREIELAREQVKNAGLTQQLLRGAQRELQLRQTAVQAVSALRQLRDTVAQVLRRN
jgi:cell division protein ZapA (FtsZ GTPase activity inhibitor)